MKRINYKITTLLLGLSLSSSVVAQSSELITSEKKVEDKISLSEIRKFDKRLTLGYSMNMSSSSLMDITSYELNYGIKWNPENIFWYEGFISSTSSTFGAFAENSNDVSSSTSEGNYIREEDLSESFTQFGLGLGYNAYYLNSFFKTSNFQENMKVYATYTSMTETMRSESYSGFGYKASYAVEYFMGRSTSVGVVATYNNSFTKRATSTENETSSSRSLQLSYKTIGAQLSLFY